MRDKEPKLNRKLKLDVGGDWTARELADFFSNLSMLYNVITISKSSSMVSAFTNMVDATHPSFRHGFRSDTEVMEGMHVMDQILRHFYLGSEKSLSISKISMGSPGEIKLEGDVKTIESLGDLIRIALEMKNEDSLEMCREKVERRLGKSLLREYRNMEYRIIEIVCGALDSLVNLQVEEKVLSVSVTT